VRTSLSPQLSRLKDDKKIKLDGLTWSLAPADATAESLMHDIQELLSLPKKTATDR
jgi:hypothetical protein